MTPATRAIAPLSSSRVPGAWSLGTDGAPLQRIDGRLRLRSDARAAGSGDDLAGRDSPRAAPGDTVA